MTGCLGSLVICESLEDLFSGCLCFGLSRLNTSTASLRTNGEASVGKTVCVPGPGGGFGRFAQAICTAPSTTDLLFEFPLAGKVEKG